MSQVNTPVVYRSKMLNGYEEELHYNEYMASNSMVTTMVMTFFLTLGFMFLRFGWIRSLVNRLLPVSGEGPTKEELKGCYFTGLYIAKTIPRVFFLSFFIFFLFFSFSFPFTKKKIFFCCKKRVMRNQKLYMEKLLVKEMLVTEKLQKWFVNQEFVYLPKWFLFFSFIFFKLFFRFLF